MKTAISPHKTDDVTVKFNEQVVHGADEIGIIGRVAEEQWSVEHYASQHDQGGERVRIEPGRCQPASHAPL